MKFHRYSFVNKYGQTVVHQYYQHADTEQDCILDEIGWYAEKWNKRVEDGESK